MKIHEAVEKDPNLGRARAWRVCSSSRLLPVPTPPDMYAAFLDDAKNELDSRDVGQLKEINQDTTSELFAASQPIRLEEMRSCRKSQLTSAGLA